MAEGPRRVIRLALAGDVDGLLACQDVWRCSGCNACTRTCPMEVDVAAMMAEVRELQRAFGDPLPGACRRRRRQRPSAAREDGRRRRLRRGDGDPGIGPRDLVDAASQGARRIARHLRRTPKLASPTGESTLFYAGSALDQDPALKKSTLSVAADLGLALGEPSGAGCCGHPAAASPPACPSSPRDRSSPPARPATARSPRPGSRTTPMWQILTEAARRQGRKLTGPRPRFVPYVGCLADRDGALALLAETAELAGVESVTTYPSLHAGCCGGLGGVYRGPSEEVLALRRVRGRRARSDRHAVPSLPGQRALRRQAGGRRHGLVLAGVLPGRPRDE